MNLVLGIGNPLIPEDSVGREVVKRLAQEFSGKAEFVDCSSSPENFVSKYLDSRIEKLIVVDVGEFGGSPGEVRVYESVRERVIGTTHKTSISHLVSLLSPSQVFLVLIQRGSSVGQVLPEVTGILRKLL